MDSQGGLQHHYSIDITSILSVMDPLGILWHPIMTKGQDFASLVVYVGFLWDLQCHTVLLLEKKHLKYLDKTQAFQALVKLKVSRKDILSIHGTL